jgi:hypothetical protein
LRKLSKASPKSGTAHDAGDKRAKTPKPKITKPARKPKSGTRAAAWKEFTDQQDQYMTDYWNTLCEVFELDPKEHPYRKPRSVAKGD